MVKLRVMCKPCERVKKKEGKDQIYHKKNRQILHREGGNHESFFVSHLAWDIDGRSLQDSGWRDGRWGVFRRTMPEPLLTL